MFFEKQPDTLSAVSLCDEFLKNEMTHTLFETFFFLKDYQNPYVKPQSSNKEFAERRRQQHLFTCNT